MHNHSFVSFFVVDPTGDNFDSNCVKADGLCLIALLNPADDNAARIAVLEELHNNRQGGFVFQVDKVMVRHSRVYLSLSLLIVLVHCLRYTYSWASGTCHPEFMKQFNVDPFSLPTVVAVSPKKVCGCGAGVCKWSISCSVTGTHMQLCSSGIGFHMTRRKLLVSCTWLV